MLSVTRRTDTSLREPSTQYWFWNHANVLRTKKVIVIIILIKSKECGATIEGNINLKNKPKCISKELQSHWRGQKEELTQVTFVEIFFINKLINLFIYFWLCWVLVSVRGLSLVAARGGHSSSWRTGLSRLRPLLLRSTDSRHAGSVVVAHGPSCSTACGILPDQGSNPCPLHWQADSQPLRHQGSPFSNF